MNFFLKKNIYLFIYFQ